jgi:ABC-type multidrug transport system permease subunit
MDKIKPSSIDKNHDSVEARSQARVRRLRVRWSSYRELVKARLRELMREPELIFWVFIFPLLIALGLGIAFRDKPVDPASVAIVAGPRADNIRDKIERSLDSAKVLVAPLPEAMNCFRLGRCDLVIVPQADGSLEYRYDPARSQSALAQRDVDNALQSLAGRKNLIATTARSNSEPGSRYIDFLIPGLLGMNAMNSGMWGVGFALVDMRQRKLLKRFAATPMRRSDFLLALMSSRLLLMVIEVALLLFLGVWVFDMRIVGSWASIIGLGTIGSVVFGAMGLLTASRARKIETASGLINFVMMPMWIFSGVFFSYERFPEIFHPFIRALPLTALNDALRAAILEGASFSDQASRLLVLTLWCCVSFVAALRLFRWS